MIWLEHCVWSPNRPTLVASHFGKYSTEQKKTPLQEKVVTPKICDKSMKHLNLHEGSQCFVSNSILAENQQILVENHLSAPWKFVKKHQPTKLKPLKHLKKTRPPQQNWIAFGCFSYFLDILKFLVKTFETLQLGFQNLEIPRNAFFLHVILNQLLQLTNLLRFQPACLGLSEATKKKASTEVIWLMVMQKNSREV